MRNTQFKVEVVFGDILSKVSISPVRATKLSESLAEVVWIIILK